jgi:hypothetical protein
VAAELEGVNETVLDVVFFKNRQASEHREIVYVGRSGLQAANHQPMLRVGRTVEKPFEIHWASGVADLVGIYFLQTKDVRLEAFKLWSEHGRPLFRGGAMPAPITEAFEIEGGNAHCDWGQCPGAHRLRLLSLILYRPISGDWPGQKWRPHGVQLGRNAWESTCNIKRNIAKTIIWGVQQ